jgi:hypothetical protein
MHAYDATVYPLLVALHRFIAAVDGGLVAMHEYGAPACACIVTRDACNVIGNADDDAHRSVRVARFRFLSTLSGCTAFFNPDSVSPRTARIVARLFFRATDARPAVDALQDEEKRRRLPPPLWLTALPPYCTLHMDGPRAVRGDQAAGETSLSVYGGDFTLRRNLRPLVYRRAPASDRP